MKNIGVILFILLSKFASSQTKFSVGFNEGYKIGYCYQKDAGCFCLAIPMSPNPILGEDFNSYEDGYNRGFLVGLGATSNSKQSNNSFNNSNSIAKITPYSPDFSIYEKALIQAQNKLQSEKNAEIQNELQRKSELAIELDAFDKEMMSPDRISRIKNYVKLLNLYHNSFNDYPIYLPDGNYEVTITDSEEKLIQNNPFLILEEKYYALIQDNKIIYVSGKNENGAYIEKIPRNGMFGDYKSYNHVEVLNYSTSIEKGIALISTTSFLNGKEIVNNIYNVYFTNALTDYQNAKKCISQIKKNYKNVKTNIIDGWHFAKLYNGVDFCDTRSVFVENNRIIKYKNNSGLEINIVNGGLIINGHSNFSTYVAFPSGLGGIRFDYEVYFD